MARRGRLVAARPARARRRRCAGPAGVGRDPCTGAQSGLTTLEWMLVVGAAVGFAASTAVAVQRVVDASTAEESERAVRVVEADTAAAVLERLARCQRSLDCPQGQVQPALDVAGECRRIERDYRDVVASAQWVEPAKDGDEPRCSLRLLAEPG